MSESRAGLPGLGRVRRTDLSPRDRASGSQTIGSVRRDQSDRTATRCSGLVTDFASMPRPSRRVPATRAPASHGSINVTYYGYWWGNPDGSDPVHIITQPDPLTIRPRLGFAPPRGRATITCKYDNEGLFDVTASYTSTKDGVESTAHHRWIEPNAGLAFTEGEGRVAACPGVSRPLLYMTGCGTTACSDLTKLDLNKADVYIEALGDWGADLGQPHVYQYGMDVGHESVSSYT